MSINSSIHQLRKIREAGKKLVTLPCFPACEDIGISLSVKSPCHFLMKICAPFKCLLAYVFNIMSTSHPAFANVCEMISIASVKRYMYLDLFHNTLLAYGFLNLGLLQEIFCVHLHKLIILLMYFVIQNL